LKKEEEELQAAEQERALAAQQEAERLQ